MYFMALALDYDGTLAYEEKVSAETIEALTKVKASGRKLIMVTGRQLDELKQIFDRLDLFDLVVAENGALIYAPQFETQRLLGELPPMKFVTTLQSYGIPITVGKVIVATYVPHELIVLEVIRSMGLELKIVFNKGSVMVLPSNIDKATGLSVALKELGLTEHNVIGMGDAENDHVFLRTTGLGIAVANAPDSVKQSAGFVTKGSFGRGVEELIELLLEDENSLIAKTRHKITIGFDSEDSPLELIPSDRVLIAGYSGSGKSTLATAITEKMADNAFQFCIFDPEGDYEKLENAIRVGDTKSFPSQDQTLELLQDPTHNVVINTLGVDLEERPFLFAQLAPKLISLKASLGRPHWIIIDEAHHLIPAEGNLSVTLPTGSTILITVHPEEIIAQELKALNVIILLGPKAPTILKQVSEIIGESLPETSLKAPTEDEVLVWQRSDKSNIVKIIKAEKPKQHHKRHTKKYATGNLSEEFNFYFRGPNNTLNLRAQNLMIFLQIAEGIDDATWMHHLRKKDYSDWFRKHIKDDKLADATLEIESDTALLAAESKEAIASLIKELYTAPASKKD